MIKTFLGRIFSRGHRRQPGKSRISSPIDSFSLCTGHDYIRTAHGIISLKRVFSLSCITSQAGEPFLWKIFSYAIKSKGHHLTALISGALPQYIFGALVTSFSHGSWAIAIGFVSACLLEIMPSYRGCLTSNVYI